jgi:Tfp pilus assembly protein PilV
MVKFDLENRFASLSKRVQLPILKGQTLIEALASLAILSIVITAISVSVTTSLNNAKYDQYLTLATKYAQQGSEIVLDTRDESYIGFKAYNGIYCLAKGQTTLGSAQIGCTTKNVDNFIRSITIQQAPGCGTNVALITVSVAFTDAKCQTGVYCHKAVDNTCLSTVNPIQAP